MKKYPGNFVLRIQNVSCTFERWGQKVSALKNLTLTVSPGEWIVIAGHNGAGKSTLLKILAGQIVDFTGSIYLNDKSLINFSEKDKNRTLFMVYQDPNIGSASALSVYENLLIADPSNSKFSTRELERKYEALLKQVGLQLRLHHPAQFLSGGERQLLAFLIAQIRPVDLVLLDEPLGAMDSSRTALCLNLLEKFHEEGKTLLMITHDLTLAANIGTRTIILADGQIIYDEYGKDRCATHIREHIENSII